MSIVDDLPSVVAISGNHRFLRDRFLRRFVSGLEAEGRLTDRVDASKPGALSGAMSGGALFCSPTQVVVDRPQDADPARMLAHLKSGDKSTILILYTPSKLRGNTKYAKWVKKHVEAHKVFESPGDPKKEYLWTDPAQEFVTAEAKARGFRIASKVARAIVSRIGPIYFGMLSYEVEKASILAGARKSGEIEVQDVAGSLAAISVSATPVFRALEAGPGSVPMLAKALAKARKSSGPDPTMGLCRRLGPMVVRWLAAASFADGGIGADAAASKLGINPWYYRNHVLPTALVWDVEPLKRLVVAIAESERAVLSGRLDPWSGFVSRVLLACKPVGG